MLKIKSQWILIYLIIFLLFCSQALFSDETGTSGLVDRSRLPEPVLDNNPELIDLYWQAWQYAYEHIHYDSGAPQSPFMDEAFWDGVIWIWDTEFMTMFCKYAPDYFPGVKSLDNFYKVLHDGVSSTQVIWHPDNPPFFAWIEWENYKYTNDKERLIRLINTKQYLQKHFSFIEDSYNGKSIPGAQNTMTIARETNGYAWTGVSSGMDNTPRGSDLGGHDSIYWVDLIAQQALAAKYIALIANEIGNSAVRDEYNQKYNELKTKINSLYWDSTDQFYYDISKGSGSVPVSGVYHKITNRHSGMSLYDSGDNVRYGTGDNDSYYWEVVDAEGSWKRIRNKATGEYMHIENNPDDVKCNITDPGNWWSAQWQFIDKGGYYSIQCRWEVHPDIIHVEYDTGYAEHDPPGTLNSSSIDISKWWSAQWSFSGGSTSGTDNVFSRVKTPASYWPMAAEIPDNNQANSLKNYAMDPRVFGGLISFPSVARNDSHFDSNGGYWNGAVWLPTAYMSIKALEKYGYYNEADQSAVTIVDHMLQTYNNYYPSTIWENYDPDEYKPGTSSQMARENFCGWSALGPISLLIENYLGFHVVDAQNNRIEWRKYQAGRHGIKRLKFGNIVTDIISNGDYIEITSSGPYTLIINEVTYNIQAGFQSWGTDIGDVNNDGTVDIVDALLVAQYYVGLNPSNFDRSKADTNCDNNVDIVDALLIAQYYVGLIAQFC